ncbi:hypothetical protein [Thermogemmatispora sp.]|uniref:hypothetical protein n=1 Tax=Thermogemmatispora sp. TaxID=1968838 RepID=UPI0035E46641
MVTLSRNLLLYGAQQPPAEPLPLRAGPLTLLYEQGMLRSLRLGSQEVVRAIYAAVRDHNWNTIEPQLHSLTIEQAADGFLIQFRAEHVSGTVDFSWDGSIRGEADGTVTFAFRGQARRSFLKNRIGFCVLHPPALAGLPVEIETPQGWRQSRFPEQIAPHQPFLEMLAMRHAVPGLPDLQLELRFEGDLFETEDQRNWTDASFKTYCTPLALPFPVRVEAGQRIEQRIVLRLLGKRPSLPTAATVSPASAEPSSLQLTVTLASPAAPAQQTTLPPLGLMYAPEAQPLSRPELERLAALRLSHLWLELDLLEPAWRQRLVMAGEQARTLGLPLELSLVCGAAGEGLAELVTALADLRPPLARLFCFLRTSHVTTAPLARRLRSLLQQTGIAVPLGGGSRANFAEFNRAELPLELLDLAGYPITPQVHAFDWRTLVENLEAQSATVRSARAIVDPLPLSVGPVTLKPRFNAVATAPPGPPEPGRLPEDVDLRQLSLFAVAWTLGSIAQLAASGVNWLTYYETFGWRGIMERAKPDYEKAPFPSLPGARFPLFYLFADLGAFAGATLLPVTGLDPLVCSALALRRHERLRLLLANLTASSQTVRLRLPPLRNQRLSMLDETNVELALLPGETSSRQQQPLPATMETAAAMTATVRLLPCAYVCIDGELEPTKERHVD